MHTFSDLKVCTIDINLKSSAVEKIPNSQKFLATVFILCFHNWAVISRPWVISRTTSSISIISKLIRIESLRSSHLELLKMIWFLTEIS